MRVDTIFKQHFTFEYWIPTANVGGQIVWAKKDDRKGLLVPGGASNSMMIADEPMDFLMQIRNVRDRSGTVVFSESDGSYPMYIITADPQLDPFSNVIAYRHRLNKDLPRDYSTFLQTVLEVQ